MLLCQDRYHELVLGQALHPPVHKVRLQGSPKLQPIGPPVGIHLIIAALLLCSCAGVQPLVVADSQQQPQKIAGQGSRDHWDEVEVLVQRGVAQEPGQGQQRAVHQDEAMIDDAAVQCPPWSHVEPAEVQDHSHNGPVELLRAR